MYRLKNIRKLKKGDTCYSWQSEYTFKVHEAEAILEDAYAQTQVLM